MTQVIPKAIVVNNEVPDTPVRIHIFRDRNNVNLDPVHWYADPSTDATAPSVYDDDELSNMEKGYVLLWKDEYGKRKFTLPYRYVDSTLWRYLALCKSFQCERENLLGDKGKSATFWTNHKLATQWFSLNTAEGVDFTGNVERFLPVWTVREDRPSADRLLEKVSSWNDRADAILAETSTITALVLEELKNPTDPSDLIESITTLRLSVDAAVAQAVQFGDEIGTVRYAVPEMDNSPILLGFADRLSNLRRVNTARYVTQLRAKDNAKERESLRERLRESVNAATEISMLGEIFPVLKLLEVDSTGRQVTIKTLSGVEVKLSVDSLSVSGPQEQLAALLTGGRIGVQDAAVPKAGKRILVRQKPPVT